MGNILQLTPCATAALNHFGVDGCATWNERTGQNVWPGALRRAGFGVRSRMSHLRSKERTVGGARARMRTIADNEPGIIAFIVRVPRHVLVIDRSGITVVDTAPRKRDARRIVGLFAIIGE